MNDKSGKVVKTLIPGHFEMQLDEKRLSFLISSFVSPAQGTECSVVSLRNMIWGLRMKYPGSWKDVLGEMVRQASDAGLDSYLEMFEGRSLTKGFGVLSLPEEPLEIVKSLFWQVEHPEFGDKLRKFFMECKPEVLFFRFCYGDVEDFFKFVTLYYLYDSQALFEVFKQYIDKTFENKPIELLISYLTSHEKVLKIFPNGKLLHSFYSTLSKSLSSQKGAKQLAHYTDQSLRKNSQPPQISLLYILCEQKDQFEKFHSDLCIKRLLKSFNPSLELQTCELIQQLAGPDSMDTVVSLITSSQSHQLSTPKMNVLITTQKNLSFILSPNQSLSDFTPSCLPPELNALFSEYLARFKEAFPHKTLNFFHHSGFLELQYGSCLLTCNFTQACILLLFNQSQYNKKEDIVEKLQCSNVFKTVVLDEVESLMRVFEESERGLEVSLSEGLSIDLTQREDTEVEDTSSNFDEKNSIDCFIVRLLKHQKQTEFTDLLQRIKTGLKFVPTETTIKERLKNLESRGFLWIVENTIGYVP